MKTHYASFPIPHRRRSEIKLKREIMKQTIFILFIFASSLFADTKDSNTNPEVRPIINLITAVNTQDMKLLESVFSQRMVKSLSTIGWERALKGYTEAFKIEFEDYSLKNFTLEFKESQSGKGQIEIIYKEKKPFYISVIKEGLHWKMDEK